MLWVHYAYVPQKMLQSPYFFFDVVYLHNGVEEQGDETSWRVSVPVEGSFSLIATGDTVLTLLHKTHVHWQSIFKKICPSRDYKTWIVLLTILC